MHQDAHYRPIAHPILLSLEIVCALAALFFIAGGVYGVFADFQPSPAHVASARIKVALTWAPIGLFILTDVMMFRRNIARMFISRVFLVILSLFVVTYLGVMMFWFAGVPAWRSVGAEGPEHVYSYTILGKARSFDGWFCPGKISFNSRILFKGFVCAPEEIWRAAKVGEGLTLVGVWTPDGIRYSEFRLKR